MNYQIHHLRKMQMVLKSLLTYVKKPYNVPTKEK